MLRPRQGARKRPPQSSNKTAISNFPCFAPTTGPEPHSNEPSAHGTIRRQLSNQRGRSSTQHRNGNAAEPEESAQSRSGADAAETRTAADLVAQFPLHPHNMAERRRSF